MQPISVGAVSREQSHWQFFNPHLFLVFMCILEHRNEIKGDGSAKYLGGNKEKSNLAKRILSSLEVVCDLCKTERMCKSGDGNVFAEEVMTQRTMNSANDQNIP